MEWFGNKNPQLLKAGGTLAAMVTDDTTKTKRTEKTSRQ